MSSSSPFFAMTSAGLTGLALVAAIFLSADFAAAADATKARTSASAIPLDETDQIAALNSLSLALRDVPDGSNYVWHRANGRLSGIVRLTASFKDATGAVCRHIVVVLSTVDRTERTETIACRLASGRWQLDG